MHHFSSFSLRLKKCQHSKKVPARSKSRSKVKNYWQGQEEKSIKVNKSSKDKKSRKVKRSQHSQKVLTRSISPAKSRSSSKIQKSQKVVKAGY